MSKEPSPHWAVIFYLENGTYKAFTDKQPAWHMEGLDAVSAWITPNSPPQIVGIVKSRLVANAGILMIL